ncbi:MAG: hypothetical protein EPO11_04605 [Gammaproteobacteria bacterium]|nr:MAG: hypothetical protein EPO11_04605 [Gammaproteobacteria bacterium]
MVTINLLPWRDHLRRYQEKSVKRIILIAISVSLSLLFAVHWTLKEMIHREQLKVLALQALQPSLPAEDSSGKFDRARFATQNLFAELAKGYDDDVCFTGITREKNSITFSGSARTAAELTDFLKNWHATYLFAEIKIDQLQYQPDNGWVQFRFRAIER